MGNRLARLPDTVARKCCGVEYSHLAEYQKSLTMWTTSSIIMMPVIGFLIGCNDANKYFLSKDEIIRKNRVPLFLPSEFVFHYIPKYMIGTFVGSFFWPIAIMENISQLYNNQHTAQHRLDFLVDVSEEAFLNRVYNGDVIFFNNDQAIRMLAKTIHHSNKEYKQRIDIIEQRTVNLYKSTENNDKTISQLRSEIKNNSPKCNFHRETPREF